VIHRDIKPANIMITSSGSVKIMDFGIAKAGGGMTSTGQVLGTPNYMSPEQLKGRAVDGRSDIFSTGVLLYEALTGEKPFDGQNVTTIIYKIVNEMPISPRALDATVHPGLSLVILKALAKSADDRYQSGSDLARDLTNFRTLGVEGSDSQVLARPTYLGGVETLVSSGPLTVTSLRETTNVVPAAAAAAPAKTGTAVQPAKIGASIPKPSGGFSRPVKLALLFTPLFVVVIAVGLFLNSRKHTPEAAQPQPQPAAAQLPVTPTPQPPATTVPPESLASTPETTPQTPAVDPNAAAVTEPAAQDPDAALRDQKRKAAEKKAQAQRAALLVGDLHVTSTPPGATVTIDGRHQDAWVTPFTAAKLPTGSRTLIFSKQGFASKELNAEIAGGKATTVDAQLAQAVGMINVRSNPAGAEIFVDDKPTGKSTPSLLTVSPGEHNVKVTKQGFEPAASAIKVAESQRVDFAPDLTASAVQPQTPAQKKQGGVFSKIFGKGENGTVSVRSMPVGAVVEISGSEKKSLTAPGKLDLKPGKYEISFSLKGYKSVKRSITIEKGKTLGLEEVLEKE
jgi:hypothetical protein